MPQSPTPPLCRGYPNYSHSLFKPQQGLSPPAPLHLQHVRPPTQSRGGHNWKDDPSPSLCPASPPSAQITTFALFLSSRLEIHLEQLPSSCSTSPSGIWGQGVKVWEQTGMLQPSRAPSTVQSMCKHTSRTSPCQKTQVLWQPLLSQVFPPSPC